MSFEDFTRVAPLRSEPPVPLDEPDDQGGPDGQEGSGNTSMRAQIECYVGRRKIKSYGISVEGSGSWAQGNIAGSIMAYDYKTICKVYNLSDRAPLETWVGQYRKDSSGAGLIKVFEQCKIVPISYSVNFHIEGNDFGISGVYVTCRVIRLKYQGISKDFLVTLPSSFEVFTPQGQQYPGGFRVTT